MKATYIAPKIRIHKLALASVMETIPGGSGDSGTKYGGSKSAFADFGDPSDEAPSSSWDNSAY